MARPRAMVKPLHLLDAQQNTLNTRLNTKFRLTIIARQVPVENRPRNKNRSKYVCQQTDDQSNRKALYRAGPKQQEEGRGNERRDVRVYNRPEGVVESQIHGRRRSLAVAQFLAYAFEYQHVGINA